MTASIREAIDVLRAMRPLHYALAVTTGLAVVSAGFLLVVRYSPEWLTGLDVVKLVLLSVSIALPIAAANWMMLAIPLALRRPAEVRDDPGGLWFVASALTVVIVYSTLYWSYLSAVSFREFTLALGMAEACVGVICMLGFFFPRLFPWPAAAPADSPQVMALVEVETVEQEHRADGASAVSCEGRMIEGR